VLYRERVVRHQCADQERWCDAYTSTALLLGCRLVLERWRRITWVMMWGRSNHDQRQEGQSTVCTKEQREEWSVRHCGLVSVNHA
jgi:hypothetical protein